MKNYNSIVILGPTAVGKTSVAVKVAFALDGEILSADSRQTYRGLDIGSGKDLSEYTINSKKIPYHLIDIADLSEEYTVFNYMQDFYPVFDDVIKRKKIPVITGGTGLYLDSVIRGYDLIDVPENVELRKNLESKSLEELGKILLSLKPELHNKSDLCERERVIRAIEIAECEKSDDAKKIREKMYPKSDIRPLIFGTTLSRPVLWENIHKRLIERIQNGMIEEVMNLHKNGVSFERLEKLGLEYRYCARFIQGKFLSKEEMTEKLFISIRQFAKRQQTWFRFMEKNNVKIHWLKQTNSKDERVNEILEFVKNN